MEVFASVVIFKNPQLLFVVRLYTVPSEFIGGMGFL